MEKSYMMEFCDHLNHIIHQVNGTEKPEVSKDTFAINPFDADTMTISQLWDKYHEHYNTLECAVKELFPINIKDFVCIHGNKLWDYSGKNKEERILDAMNKTSKQFMIDVVKAIYEAKIQCLKGNYDL